jgi:cytochrome c oxidase cbb3-type subunit 3
MTGFWSTWVIVLACVTAAVGLFLFFWAIFMKIPTDQDGTTGHVWAHGVLREAVRPLPWWWVMISIGAFLFGACYLVIYPGFGNFAGRTGWTSGAEHDRDAAANRTKLEAKLAGWRTVGLEQMATDKDAVSLGHRLFLDNCAACHGIQGKGNRIVGAPDLTDADWLYGGSADTILASINDGRKGAMPPLLGALGHSGVNEVAAYVVSIRGTQVPAEWAAAGKVRFQAVCAACHGVEGKGNPALGAPDLTDDAWLYGGNIESVVETVSNGRSGVMPAWRHRLSEDDVRLTAAWVLAQGIGRVAHEGQGTSKAAP